MRRNKIKKGWDAVPSVRRKKFEKIKISWTVKYEHKHLSETSLISVVIKWLISFSLLFSFLDKNFNRKKKSITVNKTYNILTSSSFKFIPSSVAFYLLLAIIPILIICFSTMSFINSNWTFFLTQVLLSKVIPGIQSMIITIDFQSNTSVILVLLFIFSSLWFASKGINKFSDSFSELYEYNDTRNFIIKRLKSIIVVVCTSLYFVFFGLSYVPLMKAIYDGLENENVFNFLYYMITFIYFILFGYLGIGLLFKYISPIRIKWKYLNLGILTTLIPTVIFVLLFSTLSQLMNYEKFGIASSFFYLMLFMLYISYFLHAGIIINSSYYKTNVFANITTRKSLVWKRIVIILKNTWYKFKYYLKL